MGPRCSIRQSPQIVGIRNGHEAGAFRCDGRLRLARYMPIKT
jgi:hypothetical protein